MFVDVSMNTNIISTDELVFNDKYLKKNIKIISNFLKSIIDDKNIHKVDIIDYELVPTVLEIINTISGINCLNIKDNKKIDFNIYDKLLKCKYLKNINCYDIAEFMLDKLDDNDIKVETRCEIFAVSKIISENSLTNYASIYYKESININFELTTEDLADLNSFLKINRYLKVINIYDFSNRTIDRILESLKETNKRNIKILIHTNEDNFYDIDDSIKSLKDLNKDYKKLKVKICIKYSNEYVKKNYFKQVNFTNLRVCSIIILVAVISTIIFIQYKNYSIKKETKKIDKIITNNSFIDDEKETVVPTEVEEKEEEKNTNIKPLEKDFDTLLSINSETVGFLKINNTYVNYPVVQHSDNEYYLNRTFYNGKNFNGWIFMDYRNSIDDLDKNTIIYGHDTDNGTMFGSLARTLQSWWYDNDNNTTISFDTINSDMNFKIFSIYKTAVTNDYMTTKFINNNEFIEFISLIKGRSIKDFGVDVSFDDKILTLSTCQDNGDTRLVIHAKLVS